MKSQLVILLRLLLGAFGAVSAVSVALYSRNWEQELILRWLPFYLPVAVVAVVYTLRIPPRSHRVLSFIVVLFYFLSVARLAGVAAPYLTSREKKLKEPVRLGASVRVEAIVLDGTVQEEKEALAAVVGKDPDLLVVTVEEGRMKMLDEITQYPWKVQGTGMIGRGTVLFSKRPISSDSVKDIGAGSSAVILADVVLDQEQGAHCWLAAFDLELLRDRESYLVGRRTSRRVASFFKDREVCAVVIGAFGVPTVSRIVTMYSKQIGFIDTAWKEGIPGLKAAFFDPGRRVIFHSRWADVGAVLIRPESKGAASQASFSLTALRQPAKE